MIEEQINLSHCFHMNTVRKSPLPTDLLDAMKPERIGYRLSLIRRAHDLKPAEISDMLDIERTYWSRFEGGKRAITDNVAALLVDRFGVTLDFIILGRWDRLPLDLAEKMRRLERQ